MLLENPHNMIRYYTLFQRKIYVNEDFNIFLNNMKRMHEKNNLFDRVNSKEKISIVENVIKKYEIRGIKAHYTDMDTFFKNCFSLMDYGVRDVKEFVRKNPSVLGYTNEILEDKLRDIKNISEKEDISGILKEDPYIVSYTKSKLEDKLKEKIIQ